MSAATVEGLGDLCGRIKNREYRHLAIWVGSVVSAGSESNVPSVNDIRSGLVLRPLSQIWKSDPIGDLARRMLPPTASNGAPVAGDSRERELWETVRTAIPFEEFMGCLDAANSEVAYRIIDLACGPAGHGRPNRNHELIALIAETVLRQGHCEAVTILTTNYDRCLEAAIQPDPVAWESIASGLPRAVRIHRCECAQRPIHLVKIHGCVSDRQSLVYTFSAMAELVFFRDLCVNSATWSASRTWAFLWDTGLTTLICAL